MLVGVEFRALPSRPGARFGFLGSLSSRRSPAGGGLGTGLGSGGRSGGVIARAVDAGLLGVQGLLADVASGLGVVELALTRVELHLALMDAGPGAGAQRLPVGGIVAVLVQLELGAVGYRLLAVGYRLVEICDRLLGF